MFCEQSAVRPGEILFVRVGAGCYGRTALVPSGLTAQADDWIHVLTPLAEVDNAGLVEWFNSEAGRSEVRRLAKGVAVAPGGDDYAFVPAVAPSYHTERFINRVSIPTAPRCANLMSWGKRNAPKMRQMRQFKNGAQRVQMGNELDRSNPS